MGRVPRKGYAGQCEVYGSLCPVCRCCVCGELCSGEALAPPLPPPTCQAPPPPAVPCIHCTSGPRFSSPRHTSFEERRTSLSHTLKAEARLDRPAVPRCCPPFLSQQYQETTESKSGSQRPPPSSPGPDPGGASACGPAWVRWGGEAGALQRIAAPKTRQELGRRHPGVKVKTVRAVGLVGRREAWHRENGLDQPWSGCLSPPRGPRSVRPPTGWQIPRRGHARNPFPRRTDPAPGHLLPACPRAQDCPATWKGDGAQQARSAWTDHTLLSRGLSLPRSLFLWGTKAFLWFLL